MNKQTMDDKLLDRGQSKIASVLPQFLPFLLECIKPLLYVSATLTIIIINKVTDDSINELIN